MKPCDSADDWEIRKDRIIGLGERSFHKSYYPQLRQNIERLERFHTLLDRTADFVILVSLPDGTITDANASLGRLIGEPAGQLIGRSFESLGLGDAANVLGVLCQELDSHDAGQAIQTHFSVVEFGHGAAQVWLEFSYCIAILDEQSYGVMVGRDVTERKLAEERARYLSYHDAVTGLPNQLLLQDRLQQAIMFSARAGTKVALLLVDLDRFKTINDILGYNMGNRLLVEVGKRLSRLLPGTDTVCRQGGDEFLLLLTEHPEPDAVGAFLLELIARFAEPFQIDGQELTTSVSVGAAIYPEDGADFETLLKKADMAMYRAKEAGRNTYRFFSEEMNSDTVDLITLHTGLRRALETGQFVLHYQPQIDIISGALIGAEALIRWHHPELGMVPPGRFIPVAEETGLIVEIGDWVLREACREAAKWRQAGMFEPVVAVNLSALQFKRGDIESSVVRALTGSGIEPGMLELELTESILIRDTDNVLATVQRLKQMGIKLSIDDFGTGYSSLSYLKRFRVDKLKIDQSFIRDLASDAEDAAIVRAVIQMARSLGLLTIAEGVETQRVLELLRLYHCDEVQGYFIARPMPADEFMAYIATHLAQVNG